MLWGRVAWGIWWTWDARLTSMLLLWLLYVSYLMLRKLSSTGQTHTLAAVLSVFAAIDVPIVYMSIQWWRTQHPAPVFFSGDPDASRPVDAIRRSSGTSLPGRCGASSCWASATRSSAAAKQSEQDAALQAIEASLEIGKVKLSWMFGSSMAAHHLLYVYLSVWLIQGGYCAWVAWQWMRTKKAARTGRPHSAPTPRPLRQKTTKPGNADFVVRG